MADKSGGRNSHFKVVQSDSKYGMLMWQSKLQEKLLKEQKDEKELAKRRFSEEKAREAAASRASFRSLNYNAMDSAIGEFGGGSGEDNHTFNTVNLSGSHRITASPPTTITGAGGMSESAAGNGNGNSFNGSGSSDRMNDKAVEIPIMMPGPSPTFRITDTSNPSHDHDHGPYLQNHPSHENSTSRTFLSSNNYEKELPTLPKLVSGRLRSSFSCDNLAKSNSSQPQGHIGLFGLAGGAGAPRRSPSGRLVTNLQGHPEIHYHQKDTRGFDQTLRYMMDKDKIIKYKEDLDKQLEEKRRWRRQFGSPRGTTGPLKIMSSQDHLGSLFMEQPGPSYFANSGIDRTSTKANTNNNGPSSNIRRLSSNTNELAPLIRKYKSLPKLNTLSSTDVTKPFLPSPRRGEFSLSPEPQEIARGLSMQLEEKHRIQQSYQESERVAAERHFNTWDSFWGRPGHGAPIYNYRNSPTRLGLGFGGSTSNLFSPRTDHHRTDLFKAIHMTHQQGKPK